MIFLSILFTGFKRWKSILFNSNILEIYQKYTRPVVRTPPLNELGIFVFYPGDSVNEPGIDRESAPWRIPGQSRVYCLYPWDIPRAYSGQCPVHISTDRYIMDVKYTLNS